MNNVSKIRTNDGYKYIREFVLSLPLKEINKTLKKIEDWIDVNEEKITEIWEIKASNISKYFGSLIHQYYKEKREHVNFWNKEKEYVVLENFARASDDRFRDIESLVNTYIEKGYEPIGGLSYLGEDKTSIPLCGYPTQKYSQAVILKDKKKRDISINQDLLMLALHFLWELYREYSELHEEINNIAPPSFLEKWSKRTLIA